MSLLSAWALAGLLLTVPLVLAHLRRRRPPLRDVASLLAWRELPVQSSVSRRRLGRPILPLLLALQLLALIALVLGLARPASGLARPGPSRIYVVDDSIWMQAREAGGDRLDKAQRLLRRQLAQLPAGTSVAIVVAGATPSLLFSGTPPEAARAIDRLRPTDAPADLAAALTLAAGLRRRSSDRIVLLRAREDVPPAVRGPRGTFSQELIGGPLDDQGLTDAVARCDLPGPSHCEVFARVRNTGSTATDDRVQVLEDGRRVGPPQTVAVGPHSSSPVAFTAPPGRDLELAVAGDDDLPADDRAFVAVPAEAPALVTLVGARTQSQALAGALLADLRVKLRALTPAEYRSIGPGTSDLLVLDGWMPAGGLPDAPSLLLVDPPSLPGGRVDGVLTDSRLSGSEPASELLSDVNLASLSIDSGQARRVTLPSWMSAAVWSPEGPLLASGSSAGQRVAVLAFDPSASDLPQLASFPILIANLVSWSQEWAPTQATAGQAMLVQEPPGTTSATLTAPGLPARRLAVGSHQPHTLVIADPGLYTIRQQGPWGARTDTLAVNVDTEPAPASPEAVELTAPAPPRGSGTPWWPWILAVALIVLAVEWAYAVRGEPRVAVS